MWFLQVCLMPTQLLSPSEAFTGMTALCGSSISMQFLSYLKSLTPLCENKPEMICLARIRLRYRKQNPAYGGCSAIARRFLKRSAALSEAVRLQKATLKADGCLMGRKGAARQGAQAEPCPMTVSPTCTPNTSRIILEPTSFPRAEGGSRKA
jgi:hypothetical protein